MFPDGWETFGVQKEAMDPRSVWSPAGEAQPVTARHRASCHCQGLLVELRRCCTTRDAPQCPRIPPLLYQCRYRRLREEARRRWWWLSAPPILAHFLHGRLPAQLGLGVPLRRPALLFSDLKFENQFLWVYSITYCPWELLR